ncbi:kinase-like protein [Heliocybe sulcata]|uniref:Kinase-like protein n=1 Tax=Heliocybe sulcata TaxID=5364 RepID=A0A5C3MVH7_9AGAM|nr:kinase-like protein [Heliocybe sulcata]
MGSSYRGGPIPWHLSDSMSKALHRLQVKVACQNLKIPETLALSDVTVYNSQKPVDGGGFSDIFRGHWDSGSVCIKKLRVFMRTRNEQESRMMKMFCNEALIWSHLHHPNVLQFLGFDMTSFHPYICMVSPWMENGNVLSYIRENPVSEVDTQRLVCEVSRGLEYIHGRNLVHGDIKGANVVVDASGRACLADFGLAGFAQATQGAYTTETREGSKRWMAPELLNWRIPLRRTQESDVYALGCVCLEVSRSLGCVLHLL